MGSRILAAAGASQQRPLGWSAVLVASALFGVGCSGGPSRGNASDLGPECTAYLAQGGCCLQAAGSNQAAIDACKQAARNYAQAPDQAKAEASCKAANDAARAAGMCAGADAGGADAGGADAGVQSICQRYVACAYQTQPQAASGVASAYGPNGACWKTESAQTCRQGCVAGLSSLHQQYPSASACAFCSSSSDCGGSTPRCNTTNNTCFGCTSDTQCGGSTPKCDTATGTCVGCTSDADCGGATPTCSTTSHQCVCVPHPDCQNVECGTVPDGCGGQVDCGSCKKDCNTGSCVAGHCVWTPDPASNGNDCFNPNYSGTNIVNVCDNGTCKTLKSSCGFDGYDWNYCGPSVCQVWDLCDCNGNKLDVYFSTGLAFTDTCSSCVGIQVSNSVGVGTDYECFQ